MTTTAIDTNGVRMAFQGNNFASCPFSGTGPTGIQYQHVDNVTPANTTGWFDAGYTDLTSFVSDSAVGVATVGPPFITTSLTTLFRVTSQPTVISSATQNEPTGNFAFKQFFFRCGM